MMNYSVARKTETDTRIVSKMKELLDVQGQAGNWNYNPYMHGMYNGMVLFYAMVSGENVDDLYKDAPKKWLSKDENKECPYCRAATVRQEVGRFAEQMETVLRENDYKGGWKECGAHFLVNKLNEEKAEVIYQLNSVVEYDGKKNWLVRECADVANIAMMIADNFGGLMEDERGDSERAVEDPVNLIRKKVTKLQVNTCAPSKSGAFLVSSSIDAVVDIVRPVLEQWEHAMSGAKACLLAHKQHADEMQARALKAERSIKDFYLPRMDALQEFQSRLPEPYRTLVCDILANGFICEATRKDLLAQVADREAECEKLKAEIDEWIIDRNNWINRREDERLRAEAAEAQRDEWERVVNDVRQALHIVGAWDTPGKCNLVTHIQALQADNKRLREVVDTRGDTIADFGNEIERLRGGLEKILKYSRECDDIARLNGVLEPGKRGYITGLAEDALAEGEGDGA